jgi:hypothetical protein
VKPGAGREDAGGDTEGAQDEPNVKKMKSRLRMGAAPARNRKGEEDGPSDDRLPRPQH